MRPDAPKELVVHLLRSTTRAPRALTVVLAALLAVTGVVVASAPARAARPLVLVYGDSLVAEAAPFARELLRDVAQVDEQVAGFGGTAVCDHFDLMRKDVARRAPSIVVLSFSGNSLTDCMKDASGRQLVGSAAIDKYRRDIVEAVTIFRPGSPQIWLATSPISLLAEKRGEDGERRMADMMRSIAAQNPRVRVTDAAQAVLDNGWWTRTLPCLRNEPCTGGVDARGRRVNVVRAPDGGHFCPTPSPIHPQCPTHSSGALRFALGMLVAPLRAASVYDEGRAALTMAAGF